MRCSIINLVPCRSSSPCVAEFFRQSGVIRRMGSCQWNAPPSTLRKPGDAATLGMSQSRSFQIAFLSMYCVASPGEAA